VAEVEAYCKEHGITKVFALAPERFKCDFMGPEIEYVEYDEIIQYKHFYRLLQEINSSTLVVVNECLRSQNRQDLTYNCIRHFLNQTTHQAVFQYLPVIDSEDDFMTLLDFDTRSRWRREKLRPDMLDGLDIRALHRTPTLTAVPIETDEKTKKVYAKSKRDLIDGIGLKDPHTIPRNLLLLAGKAKIKAVDNGKLYIGRNNRFNLDCMTTYKEVVDPAPRTVFEFCHSFLDFSDFLSVTKQTEVQALVSDLKVDQWYFDRYTSWLERIQQVYRSLGV
jgi:hypothetical protein